MYSDFKTIVHRLSLTITVLITVCLTRVRSEDCGQEELARCAKNLKVLASTSDLSVAARKEDLDLLCPDLYSGLHCIRSYTRRCMTFNQRNHFNKLYSGTSQVIKDLCNDGLYRDEFLRHAPCLKRVRNDYEFCAKRYQATMTMVSQEMNQNTNQTGDDNMIGTVCCSFTEYLDCSELTTYKKCGLETARFTRGYLDRMSNSIIKTYCEDYINAGRCGSSSINWSFNLFLVIFISHYFMKFFIFR